MTGRYRTPAKTPLSFRPCSKASRRRIWTPNGRTVLRPVKKGQIRHIQCNSSRYNLWDVSNGWRKDDNTWQSVKTADANIFRPSRTPPSHTRLDRDECEPQTLPDIREGSHSSKPLMSRRIDMGITAGQCPEWRHVFRKPGSKTSFQVHEGLETTRLPHGFKKYN